MSKTIKARRIALREANAYVEQYHRHHGKVAGHKFSIGAYKDGQLVGVAIVGRPTGRYLDDGKTLEVTRLCTDGTKNACSFLYNASARTARKMGYSKIITFILQSESGTSLRAASHPARGAWIEIGAWRITKEFTGVAPRKGCVD